MVGLYRPRSRRTLCGIGCKNVQKLGSSICPSTTVLGPQRSHSTRVLRKETLRLNSRHVALMQPFQCHVPKNHLMLHLLKDSDSCGNPCEYATLVDEALNNTLKGACRSASQLAFESSLIL